MAENTERTQQKLQIVAQALLPELQDVLGKNVGFCGFVWSGETCYFIKADGTTDAEAQAIVHGMLKLWGVTK